MIRHISHSASVTAKKGGVAINWQKVLSEVSTKVEFFNMSKGYLISSDDAKDVVQESCLRIFLHKDEFDPSKAKFSTWIGKITVNCYFDAARKSKKVNDTFVDYSGNKRRGKGKDEDLKPDSPYYCTSEEVLAAELEELLTLALEPLCETYRKTIRCIIAGVPNEEMVEQLQCSEKNLRPTISRARKAARNSLVALGII